MSASDYKWTSEVNKKTALVNEAVYLKYVCEFNKDAGLYTIDFNPNQTTNQYDLHLLKESKNSYEFVAFMKEAGRVDFSFDTTMKKTTLESIAEMTGGLDNEKAKDGFEKEFVKHKTLTLHVEKSSVDLVGDFSLEIKRDEADKKAFSPYHFDVIIKGVGNFQNIKPLEFKIEGVKVFTQKPTKNFTLTKEGYSGEWSQKFAFVAQNSFNIEEFRIEYFDLKSSSVKELKSKSTSVNITAGYQRETLLDTDKEEEFSYRYLLFALFLISGFLVGKIKFKKEKLPSKESILFNKKVEKTTSVDELLILLILEDKKEYKDIIRKIESDNRMSLNQAKKLVGI
ncbi:hypothetical protein N9A28_05805 [Sulfurimonas sp.]|nr:hypothetical protein [Sulfurimonas sp.]